jgi:hypothetical protein
MQASKPARPDQRFAVRRVRAANAARDTRPRADVPPNGGLGLVTQDLGRRLRAEPALVARWGGAEQSVEVASLWGSEADPDPLAAPKGTGFVDRVLAAGHAVVEPIPGPSRTRSHLKSGRVSGNGLSLTIPGGLEAVSEARSASGR